MSLSHEGEAWRASGDGLAGRRSVQPAGDPGSRVGGPAPDRRWVLQARPFGDALGGLDALCGKRAGQGRVVKRMHLGRLPVIVDWTWEPPVSPLKGRVPICRSRAAGGGAARDRKEI